MISSFSVLEVLCYCLSRLSMNRRLFRHLYIVFARCVSRGKKCAFYAVQIIIRANPWGFTLCELYRRFPGVRYGAREITERNKIYRRFYDRPPICRAYISGNLEGTVDGVPAAFYLAVWLMYCQLSLNTFSIP